MYHKCFLPDNIAVFFVKCCVTSYQSTKGNLRAGRAQQNRRKNKTKIQKHPRGQNIEENDGPSTSSGPFSTSGNLLAGRSAGSIAGTPVASDWNPILGMKRFMDSVQKNIIGPNLMTQAMGDMDRNSLEYERYKTLTRVVLARLCNLVHKTGSLAFLPIFLSLLKFGEATNIPNDNNQAPLPIKIINDDLDTNLNRIYLTIGIISGIFGILAIFVTWKTNCFGCQSNPEANQENCGRDNRNDRPIIVHGDYNMYNERAFRVERDYNENVTHHNVTNNRIVAVPMEQLELFQVGPSRSRLQLSN